MTAQVMARAMGKAERRAGAERTQAPTGTGASGTAAASAASSGQRSSGPPARDGRTATWTARALALVIDTAPVAAVSLTAMLAATAVPSHGLRWWLCVLIAAAALACGLVNRTVLPVATGASLGRARTGISVVRSDGAAVTPLRLLARDGAHVLDTAAAGVGWLWPLWDERGRTFADLLTGTEVRSAAPRGWARGAGSLTAVVFLGAALACLVPAALGYTVYQGDRSAMRVRSEIGEVGPPIIEELLSYAPESLTEDFARARSLTTERYREQLVPQQEVIQRGIDSGNVLINVYWVANSAVLSADSRTARLLAFLQGQRGSEDKERLLSATVEVVFVKPGSQWLVDDLVVINKPLPTGETADSGGAEAGEGER